MPSFFAAALCRLEKLLVIGCTETHRPIYVCSAKKTIVDPVALSKCVE